MRNNVLETVTITQLSKHGFFVGDKGYYWGKTLPEEQKIPVVKGRTFQIEVGVAESGAKYVNKVLNAVETADVPAPKRAKATPVASVSVDAPMTRTDWDAKDRRISRQGVIQAAVQAVVSFSAPEELFTNAEKLALQMLEFVNK